MLDTLKRYFVGNRAPIFRIKRHPAFSGRYIPCRTGNSGGFFWRGFHVTWRKPYNRVWAYDGRHWVPAYTLTPTPGETTWTP